MNRPALAALALILSLPVAASDWQELYTLGPMRFDQKIGSEHIEGPPSSPDIVLFGRMINSADDSLFSYTEWHVSIEECRRGKGYLRIGDNPLEPRTRQFMLGEPDLNSVIATKLCSFESRLRSHAN